MRLIIKHYLTAAGDQSTAQFLLHYMYCIVVTPQYRKYCRPKKIQPSFMMCWAKILLYVLQILLLAERWSVCYFYAQCEYNYSEPVVSESHAQPKLLLCAIVNEAQQRSLRWGRGRHAFATAAQLPSTMLLASCMMHVDPLLCRARHNLIAYSWSQVLTPGSQ